MGKHINLNARGEYGSAKDKALTPQERVNVFSKLKSINKIIFLLSSYAGLRVGEIEQCRLDWFNRITIDNKEVLSINIPAKCSDIHNKRKDWNPKTKSERSTYIFEKDLWLEVENFYKYNESLGIKKRAIQERVYIFHSLILNKKISIHALRSTAQNYLKYEMQFIPEVIAQMLGHKDIRTTLQHYNTMDKAQTESYLINNIK